MSVFHSFIATAAILLVATAASEADTPAVRLVETDGTIELANERVTAVIDKSDGRVTSLRLDDGPDVLAPGGRIYFDANGGGPAKLRHKSGYWRARRRDYRLVRQMDKQVDVAFRSPGDETFPFETDLHYVLREGDSGAYVYVVYRRGADAPPGGLGQTRVVMRLREELFTHYFVNERTQGLFPPLTNPAAKPLRVTDATVMFPDGRIATKYNLADFEEDHHVHGVAGPDVGVWVISASNEYLNGGPTKQNLQVHEDEVIVLKMLHSGHFLIGGGLAFEQGESWTKFYGPFLIYLNQAESPQAAWTDAQARARQEQADWPYAWMGDPDFPLVRGRVTGRLTVQGQPAADACVILTAGDGDWQVQGKGYQFWTRADTDGTFTLSNVRAGTYALHAFVPGHAGQLRQDGVTVEAEQTTDLGTVDFQPLTFGRRLWQIGTPDRSAGEFRHGDEPRRFGLWNRYPVEFPDDVTFHIGTSDERADWNYCQPVVLRKDGGWHVPAWRVVFKMDSPQTGTAHLLVGVAGATGNPELVVTVNGVEIGRTKLPNDASVYRSATQAGHYRLLTFPFDADVLTQGRNELVLKPVKSVPASSSYKPHALPRAAVMYDFLRLDLAP